MGLIVVAGASGFIGSHLVSALKRLRPDDYVIGLVRRSGTGPEECNCEVQCDLADGKSVEKVLAQWQPDFLFHVAGITRAPTAETFYTGNVITTYNLLSAIKEKSPRTRVLISGSAAQFGSVPSRHLPITEDSQCRPASLYGLSKLAQDEVARFFAARGVNVIRAQATNLVGTGQDSEFVCSGIVRQMIHSLNETAIKVETGAAKLVRDFLDVEDAVKAYLDLALLGHSGESYIVARGESVSIRRIVELVAKTLEISQDRLSIREVSRPTDVEMQTFDIGKLRQVIPEWTPRPLQASILALVDYWRKALVEQGG